MKHIIFVNLDADATAAISEFWSKAGIESEVPPHLTLATYEKTDNAGRNSILAVAKDFAASFEGPLLRFANVGIFPAKDNTVLFLAPIVTAQLLEFHKGFHELSDKQELKGIEYYKPGQWIPHCTLDERPGSQDAGAMMAPVFSHLKDVLPISARLDSIEVLEVGNNVVSLDRHPLR
jgi:2'-5' RNA ligase